jgi:hypothetical protein
MTLPRGTQRKPTGAPEADLGTLERDLNALSVQYRERCSRLPLNDQKQTTLARLYAGARRLRQAVHEGAVADAIVEIGSNLMGCEKMALFLLREHWNRVVLLSSVGLSLEQIEAMHMNAKGIIQEAPTDDIYIQSEAEKPDRFLSSLGVTAYVPFWLDDATKGAIVFFDLLPQRTGLDTADRELLKLLSDYAGRCLSAGKTKEEILG